MNKCNEFSNIVKGALEESTTNNDLNRAYNIVRKEYKDDEIYGILSDSDDFEKPIAILNIKKINNKRQADLLLSHLTGQDGRIREAVSSKIKEIINDYEYFYDNDSLNTFINAILDINPNVVRNITGIIEKNDKMKELLEDKILTKITVILENLKPYLKSKHTDNKMKDQKNHAKNKKIFNLYWLLEALSFTNLRNDKKLKEILNITSVFVDYTIREKSAKIVSLMENPPHELLQKLKNDENFYVKYLVYDKIN